MIARDYIGAGPIYADESDSNDESMIIRKFSRSLVLNYITHVHTCSCNKTDIHFIHSYPYIYRVVTLPNLVVVMIIVTSSHLLTI